MPQDSEELSKRVKSLEAEVGGVPLAGASDCTARNIVHLVFCVYSWSVCKGSCLVVRRSVKVMRASCNVCRSRW